MANRVRPGNSRRGGVRRNKVTAEVRERERWRKGSRSGECALPVAGMTS